MERKGKHRIFKNNDLLRRLFESKYFGILLYLWNLTLIKLFNNLFIENKINYLT